MQVCRICLALDGNTYPLDSCCIRLYEQLTGLTIIQEDLLPKFVCWECKDYMFKYIAFKSRAVASHCILTEILNKDGVITESSIRAASHNPAASEPTLTSTEVCDLTMDSDTEVKMENEDNYYPEIKMEIQPDYSGNLITTEAEDEFINNCDNLITTKEEYMHDATADGDIINDATASEVSDDPLSDKLIQFASNNPEFIIIPKINVNEKDDAKSGKKVIKSLLEVLDKDMFVITELTMEEQVTELQKRKYSARYKRSRRHCEYCYRGFLDDATLQRHMEKHAESSGPLVCPLCQLRYTGPRYLRRHMKSHSRKIYCKKCNFSTNIFDNAYKHQKYHQGEKHECKFCNKTYLHRTTYLSHVRLKHPTDVVCKHCGLSFGNKTALLTHAKKVHGAVVKPIPVDGPSCARCDIRFSCQDALDTHRRVSARHADERESISHEQGYSTETTDKETQTEGKKQYLTQSKKQESTRGIKEESTEDKKQHSTEGIKQELTESKKQHSTEGIKQELTESKKQHSTEVKKHDSTEVKKHDSTEIKKEGSKERNKKESKERKNEDSRERKKQAAKERKKLRRRLRRKPPTYTSDPFPDGPKSCEQCEEKLSSPRAYFLHFRSAHKGMNRTHFYSKVAKKHMCEVCGALLPSEILLERHKYAHSSSKQFKCDRCGKLFQLEVYLQYHQKCHCGNRVDHPCGVCGKTFATKPNLQRHMVIHKRLEYKCEKCEKVFTCPINRKAHMDYVHDKKPRPKRNRRSRKPVEGQPETVLESFVEVSMEEE